MLCYFQRHLGNFFLQRLKVTSDDASLPDEQIMQRAGEYVLLPATSFSKSSFDQISFNCSRTSFCDGKGELPSLSTLPNNEIHPLTPMELSMLKNRVNILAVSQSLAFAESWHESTVTDG